jgi:hypothetical protein
MAFLGTKQFHESGGWTDWLGALGDVFKGREKFDIFCCEHCGKVEFYLEGVGESLRKKEKK